MAHHTRIAKALLPSLSFTSLSPGAAVGGASFPAALSAQIIPSTSGPRAKTAPHVPSISPIHWASFCDWVNGSWRLHRDDGSKLPGGKVASFERSSFALNGQNFGQPVRFFAKESKESKKPVESESESEEFETDDADSETQDSDYDDDDLFDDEY